jgi:hypothetical protein
MSAVTLNNSDRNCVHYLIGSESLAAGGTLTAALYACALVNRTGVKNTGILAVAKWTFHRHYRLSIINQYIITQIFKKVNTFK